MDSAKLNNLKQCIEKDLSYTFVENKYLIGEAKIDLNKMNIEFRNKIKKIKLSKVKNMHIKFLLVHNVFLY